MKWQQKNRLRNMDTLALHQRLSNLVDKWTIVKQDGTIIQPITREIKYINYILLRRGALA